MLKDRRKSLMILICIVALGLVLRLLSCLWGWPYRIHPDEKYIVEKAVDMVSRSSWEVDAYEWPGHVMTKINAPLYDLISVYKYHGITSEIFPEHKIAFYMLARVITCIFGTAMIVLAYLIIEKIRAGYGLLAAAIVAFYPVFVKHSAYATTDIPLTTFLMLIIYLALLFMEKKDRRIFYAMCALVGTAMCTKYPGVLFIFLPIYVAIWEAITEKKFSIILKRAIAAFFIVFFAVMFWGPNLVTNFHAVTSRLVVEATRDLSGAVGYGFFGNLIFYFTNMITNGGAILLLPFAIGLIWCLKNFKTNSLVLCVALLYFLCMCKMNLQLERWGMPSYAVILLIAVCGWATVFEWVKGLGKKPVSYVAVAVIVLFMANIVTGGVRQAVSSVVKENRIRALEYCEANGITEENSKYDGYTPFMLAGNMKIKVFLDENGNIKAPKNVKYLLTSNLNYDRYFADPENNADIVLRYKTIDEKCKLLMRYEEYNKTSYLAGINTVYNVIETYKFLTGEPAGATISIYELQR